MCNHYRTMPEAIPTWAEYAGFSVPADRTIIEDVWPKREATIARSRMVSGSLMRWLGAFR
jgi:hypothetical protein